MRSRRHNEVRVRRRLAGATAIAVAAMICATGAVSASPEPGRRSAADVAVDSGTLLEVAALDPSRIDLVG